MQAEIVTAQTNPPALPSCKNLTAEYPTNNLVNILEGWNIIVLKGTFQIQAVFCVIFGSRAISKTIWGIRFQELEIMNFILS